MDGTGNNSDEAEKAAARQYREERRQEMEFEKLKAETELANFNVAKKDQRYWMEVGKFVATWGGLTIAIALALKSLGFLGE